MEKLRKNIRENKVIILIITIVILLILAGISIVELTGIFEKGLNKQMLADYESQLNNLGKSTVGSGDVTGVSGEQSGGDSEQGDDPNTQNPNTQVSPEIQNARKETMFDQTENTKVTDSHENTLVVPAGFKIAEDSGNNVTEGIVIEDKEGNQFVWIPVGTIYKNNEKTDSETITLNRYTFNTSGTPIQQGQAIIEKYFTESTTTVDEFKKSVTANNGYYIGRYEARTDTSRSTSDAELTPVTEKEKDFVYNYVTQFQASQQCQAMYAENNSKFTSDLINSYAWDTAIVFLQKFGSNNTYSRQKSLNTTFEDKGTKNTETEDKICNIYDMASNVMEYTTEKSSYVIDKDYRGNSITPHYFPATSRGGTWSGDSGYISSKRSYQGWSYSSSMKYTNSCDRLGFRPILYCSNES